MRARAKAGHAFRCSFPTNDYPEHNYSIIITVAINWLPLPLASPRPSPTVPDPFRFHSGTVHHSLPTLFSDAKITTTSYKLSYPLVRILSSWLVPRALVTCQSDKLAVRARAKSTCPKTSGSHTDDDLRRERDRAARSHYRVCSFRLTSLHLRSTARSSGVYRVSRGTRCQHQPRRHVSGHERRKANRETRDLRVFS